MIKINDEAIKYASLGEEPVQTINTNEEELYNFDEPTYLTEFRKVSTITKDLVDSLNIGDIERIIIPVNVTAIEDGAFTACQNISRIVMPSHLAELEKSGMGFNADKDLVLIITQGNGTWPYKQILTTDHPVIIGLSEGFTNTSPYMSCAGLKEIYLPNSLKHFPLFRNTNLTSIRFSKNISSFTGGMDSNPLKGNMQLSSIVVDEQNPKYDSRNNCNAVIETKSNRLLAGCKNTVIPNSVTAIGSYVFDDTNITTMTIPASIKSLGAGIFRNCSLLTSVIFEDRGFVDYDDVSEKQININSLYMFQNDSALESIHIANGISLSSRPALKDSPNVYVTVEQNYGNEAGGQLDLRGINHENVVQMYVDIFNNLYDQPDSPHKITIENDALAKLTPEQIAIATDKGWTVQGGTI